LWNPEPETRIRNPDIMNDDRNNSLQQCLINKYEQKLYCCYLFSRLNLLEPQTVIAKKLFTSSEQPLATHLAWLLKAG